MSVLVQVWATPSLSIPAPISLASGVRIRAVVAEPQPNVQVPAILLETDSEGDLGSGDHAVAFRRLGKVLSRLSFSLLHPFQVFSARVVTTGITEMQGVEAILFPGCPPGISLEEYKIGYRTHVQPDNALLDGDLPPSVELAIGWFLTGNAAPNSIHQVLCHWIGLECLAPTTNGPWQCAECRGEVGLCPHCAKPTVGPKTVQSIRRYMEETLRVDRKEYKSLYQLRCSISHGGLALDPDGITKASGKAFRIQELLLKGIKLAIGRPESAPPLIEPNGMTVMGVPGLVVTVNGTGPFQYDQPGIYPG